MKPAAQETTSNQFMRLIRTLLLACSVAGPALIAGTSAQVLPKAPIRFEPNHGQFRSVGTRRNAGKDPVVWAAQGLGYSVGFTQDATLFQWGAHGISMRLTGQNPTAKFEGSSPLSASTNYFTPGFRGAVANYQRLRRHQVYPGIDLVYYGSGENLEYDFEIAAGADPSRIRMHFDGGDRVRLSATGDLVLGSNGHTITQHVPVVYQLNPAGGRVPVSAAYRIQGQRDVTIALSHYDASVPLVVDPIVTFEAYIIGSSGETSVAVTHDSQGFVYLAGNTQSSDFSTSTNAYAFTITGTQNAWLMKLNPAATSGDQVVLYSTVYGGTGIDTVTAMTTDVNGWIYITGYTTSTDLPTTDRAFQTSNAGLTDGFMATFDPSQTGAVGLLYATYMGGAQNDQPSGIAVSAAKVFVAGSTLSTDYPVAVPFRPEKGLGWDAFLTKIDIYQTGSASLVTSTYFGGSADDYSRTLTIDAAGNVYIAGITFSTDLPVSAAPYQATAAGGGDIFLTEFDSTLQFGLYSTLLGGSGQDQASSIAIDPKGRVAITGYTTSIDFPITQDALQPFLGGPGAPNAYLTILDLTAASRGIVYSTYFGGRVAEVANSLKVDANGLCYFGGYSMSPDLPVTTNAFNAVSAQGGLNGFVAIINPSSTPFNQLRFGSFITGPGSQTVNAIDLGANGSMYLTGYATADVFTPRYQPKTSGAGNADGFIWIFTPDNLQ
jgi:hypothetical protein